MYQGVYLLGENIKRGENRVNISEYKKDSAFNSYLVRRDRYDVEAITLENFGRLNGYSTEYMALLYPPKSKVTGEMVNYVNQDLNQIERILYSEDPDVFASYSRVIDTDSFVDYFLINEFFGNYDAGNNSTYFYKDMAGKLKMGPVWDFDGAMDNYQFEPFDVEVLAFQTKPWFDRLCKDKQFLKKLEKRYTKLRCSTLSNHHIIGKIDEIIAYLGGAEQREWARWGHWYTTDNRYSPQKYISEDGTVLHRNAITYPDEIYRIKTMLRDHAENIPRELRKLEKNAEFNTGLSSWMGWLLLLATASFLIPAIYIGYRK